MCIGRNYLNVSAIPPNAFLQYPQDWNAPYLCPLYETLGIIFESAAFVPE